MKINPKLKKNVLLILKIGISLFLFYFVYKKIDVAGVMQIVLKAHIGFMVLAMLFFIISQVVSSVRLNYLLHQGEMPLSLTSNLKLYLLGMFYNFFVPGGVGGDAYKVYLLNKNFEWKSKKVLKAVFLDRLIGLVAILLLLYSILIIYPQLLDNIIKGYSIYLIILFPFLFIIGRLLLSKIFKIKGKNFYITLLYSLLIQMLQVISVICIIKSLGITNSLFFAYIFVFLLSSIFSIISFAGIGIREYLFFQMSVHFALNEESAVTIGTLFTLITAIISVFGIYYHFRKPALKTTTGEN